MPYITFVGAFLSAGALIAGLYATYLLLWESENTDKLTSHEQHPSRIEPPSHRYRYHQKPNDDHHRVAEEYSWRDSKRANIAIAIGAVVAAGFAAGTFFVTRDQDKAAWQAVTDGKSALQFTRYAAIQAKRQADAASTPYIFGRFTNPLALHAWIMDDNGKYSYPNRPDNPSVQLEITNYGQSPAIITSIECAPFWGDFYSVDFSKLNRFGEEALGFVPRSVIVKDPIVVSCAPLGPVNLQDKPPEEGLPDLFSVVAEHPIWMLARVQYEDVAGNVGVYSMCARYSNYTQSAENNPGAFQPARAPQCILGY